MSKILIVDDDPAITQRIGATLKSAGHQCLAVGDGETGLRELAQGDFDLLVLDIMLPGLSGFEVCRRMHADAELYAIPVLLLSAINSEEEIAHGLEQGADDYLPKPFRPEVLLQKVQNLLNSTLTTPLVDTLTSLPGSKAIRLEMQKTIHQHQAFAAAYIDIPQLGAFGQSVGQDARAKIVRHLARALQRCGKKLESKLFQVGHVGGGHFVVLLEIELAEQYFKIVRETWEAHLPKLYGAIAYNPAQHQSNLQNNSAFLDINCCVTQHDPKSRKKTRDMLSTLTNMRNKALLTGAGIYIDRRH